MVSLDRVDDMVNADDQVILICGAFLEVVFIKLEVHGRISLNHEVLVLHISGHTSKCFPRNECLFILLLTS